MHSRCTDLFLLVARVYSHTIDLHAPAWLKIEAHLLSLTSKHWILGAPCRYTLQNLTPRTSTPSSPFPEPVFPNSEQPCEDQRPLQRGALTETPPFTGYEPNQIVEDQNYRHFTGDGQFTEVEDLRVRPLSLHQSIIASTYDSAESIATPPESDFHDEQLRALLASPLYLQERGASAERSQVYHSERENLMSSFI